MEMWQISKKFYENSQQTKTAFINKLRADSVSNPLFSFSIHRYKDEDIQGYRFALIHTDVELVLSH